MFGRLAIAVLVAAAAHAQETRAGTTAMSLRWELHPPVEGAACPSHVENPDAAPDEVFGTFPLSTSLPPVVDGDTIRVDGLRGSLRLVGLDAEETFKDPGKRRLAEVDWREYVRTENAGFDPSRPPKYGSFMGEAAADAVRQLLSGVREVRLEWDDPARKIDTFGRHLVFVLYRRDTRWVNLNVEIVRQGLSPYFVKYGRSRRLHARFAAAEEEARARGRGIWADPGPVPHYPDYPARLRWWNERADAAAGAEALRKSRSDLFILGREDDWERLRTLAGKRVTVFGGLGEQIRKEQLVLLPLIHHKGLDFMIVGSEAEIAKLAPEKENGNLLFVTGVVELYRGQPQFRAGTVTWSRQMPAGAESAPASR
jgi:endonuclease YncB( thermonuclease family)